jgi:hypothetical protein
MGEKIKLLKHYTDLGADDLNVFQIAGQFDAINYDFPLLMLLKPIYATDQSGLAGSRRSTDYNALTGIDS